MMSMRVPYQRGAFGITKSSDENIIAAVGMKTGRG